MSNLQINQFFLFDQSYYKIIENLHDWKTKILLKLDDMCENILIDMNQTFENVHYFASFTNGILIEQENLLEKVTTNEEIDFIEERINQILTEVQLLQSLSLHLNSDSVKLINKLKIKFNENNIKSISSLFLLNNNYRFLISKLDAIKLGKSLPKTFHLTSYDDETINNECILTFDVPNLDLFLNEFDSYWNLFSNTNEIRMLIPQYNISFIMGKLGETSRLLAKRYQLNEIKVFTNLCPKSDERILLIQGKHHHLIKDCLREIYHNMEERNKKNRIQSTIQLYNPANLSLDDINKIMLTNIDYGGFLQIPIKSTNINHFRIQTIENQIGENECDDDDDEDLWNETDILCNLQDDNSECVQREMIINNIYAGVIIGINATRIDRIKQKTGAYVYIYGETSDIKRTVIIRGTHGQVDRAYLFIENLINKYKNYKLPIKQRRLHGKRKGK